MPAGSGRAQLHRSRGMAGRPHATVTCKRLAQSALGLRLLTFRFGPLVQMPRRIPDPHRALVPSRRPKTEHTPKTLTPGPMSPPGPGKAPGSPGPHRRAPPRHTSRTPPSHLLRCPGPSWAPSPCRVGRGWGGRGGRVGMREGRCVWSQARCMVAVRRASGELQQGLGLLCTLQHIYCRASPCALPHPCTACCACWAAGSQGALHTQRVPLPCHHHSHPNPGRLPTQSSPAAPPPPPHTLTLQG